MSQPLLQAKNLVKSYPIKQSFFSKKILQAVRDVSFDIYESETIAIVGESGCGKSTLARMISTQETPTSGELFLRGEALDPKKPEKWREDIQMVFQDPYSSLNPRRKLIDLVTEPLEIRGVPKTERQTRAHEILSRVGIRSEWYERFAHELSGGQRQRVVLARALILKPKILVCDEAVSALDVSIQAQVINLLLEIKKEFKVTIVFITHDLGVVSHIADRVMVLYLGRIVELASKKDLFAFPKHPYTQSLLASRPRIDQVLAPYTVKGEIPSPMNPPSGCEFHPRCPYMQPNCKVTKPELVQHGAGHLVSCLEIDRI